MCELCVTDAVVFAAACVEHGAWHHFISLLKRIGVMFDTWIGLTP